MKQCPHCLKIILDKSCSNHWILLFVFFKSPRWYVSAVTQPIKIAKQFLVLILKAWGEAMTSGLIILIPVGRVGPSFSVRSEICSLRRVSFVCFRFEAKQKLNMRNSEINRSETAARKRNICKTD